VTISTAGGLPLKGWWKSPQNGSVVLLLGGLGSNRDSMLPEADMLVRHGYGVLTLDQPTCAGQISTLGAGEVEQLQSMARYAAAQPSVTRLAAMGFSIGGVTVLLGSAQIPQIRAVIAEGDYPNLYGEFTAVPNTPFSSQWQAQRASAGWYWLLTGIAPWQVSPLNSLSALKDQPVLLIHGQKEAGRTHPQIQLAAGGPATELWIVPGADHGEYYHTAPQEYERRVVEFLQRNLNK
jgi:uncharacterized protein